MTTKNDTKEPQSTAIVVGPAAKQQTLMELLEKAKGSIASVLPKHLTPERLIKVALSATSRTPDLLQCTPQSILRCVMQAAELGLEAGGLLGEAYLVPFFNKKTGKLEAVLIPGYQGLIKLARQSREVGGIEAHVVYEQDAFEFEYGLNQKLFHKPCVTGERGEITYAYAIARMRDGAPQFDVMTRAEVDRIRELSKAGKEGPWADHYGEMARKTVVRRLCKYIPRSSELTKAMELDKQAETGQIQTIDVDLIHDGPTNGEAAPETRTEALKGRLAAAAEGAS